MTDTLAVRRMSYCELAALLISGEVSPQTAPFAPVGADEVLSDTHPAPPIGSLLLWPGYWGEAGAEPHFGWKFGDFAMRFLLPEQEIIWRGEGRYTSYPPCDCCPVTSETVEEIGVTVLRLEWLDAITNVRRWGTYSTGEWPETPLDVLACCEPFERGTWRDEDAHPSCLTLAGCYQEQISQYCRKEA